jgi:hypothetical protein
MVALSNHRFQLFVQLYSFPRARAAWQDGQNPSLRRDNSLHGCSACAHTAVLQVCCIKWSIFVFSCNL